MREGLPLGDKRRSRPALFTMVGVLAVGFVANLLIRQVSDRFHEKAETTLEAAQ